MNRRNFVKRMFGVGVLSAIGICKSAKAEDKPAKFPSGASLVIDETNSYFRAVFTHLMSLHRRRCHEVDLQAIREVACYVSAILNDYLKDFRVINCEITNKSGTCYSVEYEATFLTPGTPKVWVKNYKSKFSFLLLGGPGDPVWTERSVGPVWLTPGIYCNDVKIA